MEHPTEDVLLRFTLCAASRQENRQVVRHLLSRCPSCAETVRKLREEPPPDPPISPDAYNPALDRLIARERELTAAPHPAPPRPVPFFLLH